MFRKNLMKAGMILCITAIALTGCGNNKENTKKEKSVVAKETYKVETNEPEGKVITISGVKKGLNKFAKEVEAKKTTEAPTQNPIEAPTEAPTETPTQNPIEAPTQAPTQAPAFTVEDMDAIMYATGGANVREGASTDYKVIAHLNAGTAVHVTGRASTGWYRIEINEGQGYCSDSLLSTNAPQTQAPAPQTETPAPQTPAPQTPAPEVPQSSTQDSGSGGTPDFGGYDARHGEANQAKGDAWARSAAQDYRRRAKAHFGHEPSQTELFVFINKNWRADTGFIYGQSSGQGNGSIYDIVYGDHKGVCEDAEVLLYYVCKYAGITMGSNSTTESVRNRENHAWYTVTLDGQTYMVESWLEDYRFLGGTNLMNVINAY